MKNRIYLSAITAFLGLGMQAQVINQTFNNNTEYSKSNQAAVIVEGNHLSIQTKVIYNALPDGYHLTYTFTEINSSIDALDESVSSKKKFFEKEIKKLGMEKEDVAIDALGLDPIFGLTSDSVGANKPNGYKSTHNIIFSIDEIGKIDALSKICFEANVYDLIDVVPFINNVSHIMDSLEAKSLSILKERKDFATEIGYQIQDGKASFQQGHSVLYPSERYLKSYIQNNSLYKHHISQNSTINYARRVEIDSYYNLNLKDADFIFNASEVKPVIQFVFTIEYGFVRRDREEEARLKEEQELKSKEKKTIYILDKDGKMREVKF
jgi:hypothetical protein